MTERPLTKTTWIVPVLLCAACGAFGQDYRIDLVDALGEGKDLSLYMSRDGEKTTHAFGRARRFNVMPYTLATERLVWKGEIVSGETVVTIPSDNYVPKGGKTWHVPVTLEAREKGGVVTGTYRATVDGQSREGAVSGKCFGPASEIRQLRLRCESAVNATAKKRRGKRIGMTVSVKGETCFAARLTPPGSLTDTAMAACALKQAITLKGCQLTGTMDAETRAQGRTESATPYAYVFDGLVIGDSAAGVLKVKENGKDVPDGQFLGDVRQGLPDIENGVLKLTLYGAVPPGNYMDVYISTSQGKFAYAFATTANFNNATHTVDLSKLRMEGEALKGTLAVTLNPDPWIPKDHKPVACSFEVQGRIVHGEVSGSFKGSFGPTEVDGRMDGGFDNKPELKAPKALTLKLENALFGGSNYHNRAFLGITLENGKVTGGRVGNNHTSLKGTVDTGDFTFEDGVLKGKVSITVPGGGGVKAGKYSFDVNGGIVGAVAAGEFTTHMEGSEQSKTERFWGSLK